MRFHIYEAGDGWRWRLKARNGRIVADGGEAYARKSNARRAVNRLIDDLDHPVTIVEPD